MTLVVQNGNFSCRQEVEETDTCKGERWLQRSVEWWLPGAGGKGTHGGIQECKVSVIQVKKS